MFDMFHHAPLVREDVTWNYDDDRKIFSVRAIEDVKAGEEVKKKITKNLFIYFIFYFYFLFLFYFIFLLLKKRFL